jgi:hypothetical protein
MRLRPSAVLFGMVLAASSFCPGRPGGDDQQRKADEPVAPSQVAVEDRLLREALKNDDGTALLTYFRRHTPDEPTRRELRNIVAQLGDDSFDTRKLASEKLIVLGGRAAGPLREATRISDSEIARRARACLQEIGRGRDSAKVIEAVRSAFRLKTDEAVPVLLDYLPFAEDETVAEAVRAGLRENALHDGAPQPSLVAALTDPEPVKRTVAGELLARHGDADGRSAARRLLKDSDPHVRLVLAQAFLDVREKDALPVLIDLLGELTGAERWPIEAMLERLAGPNAPALPRDDSDATRKRRREAWLHWWREYGPNLDPLRLAEVPRSLGRTMFVQLDTLTNDGSVLEIGADGKPRWRIDGLRFPIAAQLVSSDRLLVAEYAGKAVSERDLKGEIIWDKELNGNPVAVQRLPNDHTFIALRNRLLELDADRKEVWSLRRPIRDILTARKHHDGRIVLITHDGLCHWLAADGKEQSSFRVGKSLVMGVGIDLLPNGSVLIARFEEDRVTEYGPDGKILWDVTVRGPTSAFRLPNGRTLLARTATELDPPGAAPRPGGIRGVDATTHLLTEIDPDGAIIWEHRTDHSPVMAVRR